MSVQARVAALHHKPRVRGEHGIPKLAVSALVLDEQGVASDYNHYRTTRLARTNDHGVLLLALETLRSLQTEWPIHPGDLGENVLTEGLVFQRLLTPDLVPDEVFYAAFAALAQAPPSARR